MMRKALIAVFGLGAVVVITWGLERLIARSSGQWPAAIQAATGIGIVLLTFALVWTTRAYTAATHRMAERMERESSLTAADALIRATRDARDNLGNAFQSKSNLTYVHFYLSGAVDEYLYADSIHSHAITDPVTRDWVHRAAAVLRLAPLIVSVPDLDVTKMLTRVSITLTTLHEALGRYTRGEPLGPMRIPDVERADEWLKSPGPEDNVAEFID